MAKGGKLKIFISYSHNDMKYKKELLKKLQKESAQNPGYPV